MREEESMDKKMSGLDKFLRRQEQTAERLLDTMDRAWPTPEVPVRHPTRPQTTKSPRHPEPADDGGASTPPSP
jgi:hypothetical protein